MSRKPHKKLKIKRAEKQLAIFSKSCRRSRNAHAINIESEVRAALEKIGLSFRAQPIGFTSRHWIIDDGKRGHLIELWPSTGRWWSQRTGEHGKIDDPWFIVALAKNFVEFSEANLTPSV